MWQVLRRGQVSFFRATFSSRRFTKPLGDFPDSHSMLPSLRPSLLPRLSLRLPRGKKEREHDMCASEGRDTDGCVPVMIDAAALPPRRHQSWFGSLLCSLLRSAFLAILIERVARSFALSFDALLFLSRHQLTRTCSI